MLFVPRRFKNMLTRSKDETENDLVRRELLDHGSRCWSPRSENVRRARVPNTCQPAWQRTDEPLDSRCR